MGAGGDVPKIVILIQYLFHVIGLVFALVALPVQLYFLFVGMVFGRRAVWENRVLYCCLWLFRWLCSTLAVALWAGIPGGIGYFIFKETQQVGVSVGAAIGIAVAITGGMIYIRFGWPKKYQSLQISWFSLKSSYSAVGEAEGDGDGYVMILASGWADLVCFVLLSLSVLMVWRIPCLILAARENPKNWWTEILLQFVFAVFDLLLLPFYVLVLLCFWRIPEVLEDMKAKSFYDISTSASIRLKTIRSTLLGLFLDIPVLLLAFILHLLTPWNFYYLYRALSDVKDPTWSNIFSVIKDSISYTLRDIGTCFFSIIVTITLYRLPSLIILFRRHTGAGKRFEYAGALFGIILLELLILLPCLILICVTLYRIPQLYGIRYEEKSYDDIRNLSFHWKALEIGLNVVIDFPFLIVIICLSTIFFWRLPLLALDLYHSVDNYRITILKHLGLALLDIVDLPFFIAGAIVTLTGWRAYFLIKELKDFNANNDDLPILTWRNRLRWLLAQQFFLWLWDIPTAIALLILMITFYRAKDTIEELRTFRSSYLVIKDTLPENENVKPVDDEENPVPKSSAISWSWHFIVWRNFGYMMMDFPIAILAIFTLWRFPWLIQKLMICENGTERRVEVLLHLLKTCKDIIVSIFVILICLSWRVVSFIKLVKGYQDGDDEHLLISLLFLEYLKDLPFFFLYLFQLPFLWRSIPITLYIIFLPNVAEDQEVFQRRLALAFNALVSVLDVLFACLTVVSSCFFWRIPDIFKMWKLAPNFGDDNYKDTFKWYWTICIILLLELCDIVSILNICFIHICVLHIPSFYIRCFQLVQFYIQAPTDKTHTDYGDDLLYGSENEAIPGLSFSSFRSIIASEFLGSVRDFPHVFLLPLKVIGLCFIPFHYLLELLITKDVSMSFLKNPLEWLHAVSATRLSFPGLHQFAILNLVGSLILLPFFVGFIPLLINLTVIFVITLGDPVWQSVRETFGYLGLGAADGCFKILDIFFLIINIIATPALLLLQFILFFLPLFVGVLIPLPVDFNTYFDLFFHSPDVYWTAIGQIPGWIWIVFTFWFIAVASGIHQTFSIVVKNFSLFNPIVAYMWLVKRLFAGTLWKIYSGLLGIPTQWAYKHRNTCGCLGEVLIAPIILIWTLWPAIIPCVVQIYWHPQGWYLWILSAIMIVFFSYHGVIKSPYAVVRVNWAIREKVVVTPYPKIDITAIRVEIPDYGGLKIHIQGKKSADYLRVEQALLHLEGEKENGVDPFWGALTRIYGSKTISMGKMAMHPVKLVPNHIETHAFNTPNTDVYFTIHIPTNMKLFGTDVYIRQSTLQKALQSIVDGGDPVVEFNVEYTSRPLKEGAYKKHGYLVRFKTKFSAFLQPHTGLACSVMDSNGNWAEPTGEINIKDSNQGGLNIKDSGQIALEGNESLLIYTSPTPKKKQEEETVYLGVNFGKEEKGKEEWEAWESFDKVKENEDSTEYVLIEDLLSMGFEEEKAKEAIMLYPNDKREQWNIL